jgi:hypothetical protein
MAEDIKDPPAHPTAADDQTRTSEPVTPGTRAWRLTATYIRRPEQPPGIYRLIRRWNGPHR